ncbi:hypothetical protein RYH80_18870 [Halobaculum sp. MBLA0147]|uniref:hypothetical protein n=1 Tax=Halobaculum sp. MBLA0147 TaxID=3079934 RepID=UPI00352535E4
MVSTRLYSALPVNIVDKPGDAGARGAAVAGIPWSTFVLVTTLLGRSEVIATIDTTLRETGQAQSLPVSAEALYWMSVVVGPLSELFILIVVGSIAAIVLERANLFEFRIVVPVCLLLGVIDSALTSLVAPKSLVYVVQTLTWVVSGGLWIVMYKPTELPWTDTVSET